MDKFVALAAVLAKYIPNVLALPVRMARMEEKLNFVALHCPLFNPALYETQPMPEPSRIVRVK